jgi:hypothetical protein
MTIHESSAAGGIIFGELIVIRRATCTIPFNGNTLPHPTPIPKMVQHEAPRLILETQLKKQ